MVLNYRGQSPPPFFFCLHYPDLKSYSISGKTIQDRNSHTQQWYIYVVKVMGAKSDKSYHDRFGL